MHRSLFSSTNSRSQVSLVESPESSMSSNSSTWTVPSSVSTFSSTSSSFQRRKSRGSHHSHSEASTPPLPNGRLQSSTSGIPKSNSGSLFKSKILGSSPSLSVSHSASSGSTFLMKSDKGGRRMSIAPTLYDEYPEELISLAEDASNARNSWYNEKYTVGAAEAEFYHPLSYLDAPYWMSFSHGTLNWSALINSLLFITGREASPYLPVPTKEGSAVMRTEEPPARVLDIGSGAIPVWCIDMASTPGWSETTFVALDICPPQIPESVLPYSISSRLSYVQSNFTGRLPFGNQSFQFVRLSQLNMGLPEKSWTALIEEAKRVLVSGGKIEIIDSEFIVARQRKDTGFQVDLDTAYPDLSHDPFYALDMCADSLLGERFINPHPLGLISSELAVAEFKDVLYDTVLNAEMPARPRKTGEKPTPTLPTVNSRTHCIRSFTDKQQYNKQLQPVFLQAYAEMMQSSCSSFVSVEAGRRHYVASKSAFQSAPQRSKIEADLASSVSLWTAELKKRAGLAVELKHAWGWTCKMDEAWATQIEDQLPHVKQSLTDCKAHAATIAAMARDPDAQLDQTRIQGEIMRAETMVRDAQAMYREVMNRLEDTQYENDVKPLGSWKIGSYIGVKRV